MIQQETVAIGPLILIVTIIAALLGIGFGYYAARGVTSRLAKIADVADAWSHGEFKETVPTAPADEVGMLGARLNAMAGDVAELLAVRQSLAASEERALFARDLHDLVKQQVFATSMQLGAARALIAKDPHSADARLADAESMAREAQAGLMEILGQLRPDSLPLADGLRNATALWASRSGVTVETRIESVPAIAPEAKQDILLIAREALANVSSHSQAKRARVELTHSGGKVRLTVSDDGVGINSQREGGIGLRAMRERALALPSGEFILTSNPGEGVRIEVRCRVNSDHIDEVQHG